MRWYGLITLVDPDPFWFDLIIFDAVNPETITGSGLFFDWDTSHGTLVLRNRAQINCSKDSEMKVLTDGHTVWPGQKTLSLLSQPWVEAFLNNWHREKILTALANDEQRPAVLRWLVDKGFPVYRSLRSPHQSAPVIAHAVMPAKLDFLEEVAGS